MLCAPDTMEVLVHHYKNYRALGKPLPRKRNDFSSHKTICVRGGCNAQPKVGNIKGTDTKERSAHGRFVLQGSNRKR